MTVVWLLWKLICGASGRLLSLASGDSRSELPAGKDIADQVEVEASEVATSSMEHKEEEEEPAAAETEKTQEASTEEATKDSAEPAESAATTETDENLVLRCVRLPAASTSAADGRKLKSAVAEVRAAGHKNVRFTVQVEDERPASVAVLGTAVGVAEACQALSAHVAIAKEEREIEQLFLVHFTMREAWDLPQDDELVEASIANDWVDLGCEGAGTQEAGSSLDEKEEQDDQAEDEGTEASRSPQAVLRKRLREVFLDRDDVHIFMDDNPFASSQNTAVRVDFAGLLPNAWDAVARVVKDCEARGVYLSRRFEVLFWSPQDLRERLEGQVESALSHCQGAPERISKGSSGFGLTGCELSGFEDLSDNVSAVLGGHAPPGWHRMEWTPNCAGAVPHLTY